MDDPKENQSNNALVMPDVSTPTQEMGSSDTSEDSESKSQADIASSETSQGAKENPLDSYFGHTEEKPPQQSDPAASETVPPQNPTSTPLPNSQPTNPTQPEPNPISPVTPEKPKPDPKDPEVIAIQKAKRKQTIKIILVISNFAITAFLLYYYFYMSKK